MTRAVAPRCRALLWLLLSCSLSLCLVRPARAHEIDAASLLLTEVAPGRFLVRFHASSATLQSDVAAPAVYPKPCRMDGAYLECGPKGLVGLIEFPWLEGTLTRVMVEIDWLRGSRLLRVVSASAPSLTVYGVPASGLLALEPILFDYTRLGIEHILTGFDHLLFVLALALLVRKRGPLITTITAFTVAHSLTLACSVFGWISLRSAPVEACIALFEKNGFSWTYWNFRETTGPDTMALQAEHRNGSDFPVNNPLLAVLQEGWSRNHLRTPLSSNLH